MSTQALSFGTGCRRRFVSYTPGHKAPMTSLGPDAGAEYAPVFIPDSFDALYPVFLLRKVDPVQKSQIWNRYQGLWVRWTGELISFTRDGFSVRQIPRTTTFDVSVAVDPQTRARIRQYHPHDRITYVGRLNGYDDIFRTFYLGQGGIIGPAEAPPASAAPPDAGP